MIQLKDIQKIYRTDEIETTALYDINLLINKGEFAAIMGPSGCGKSTLLNIIGMLDTPDSGSYLFENKEVANLKEKDLAQVRKARIGFVFQSFNLIDELTVFENIELPLIYAGMHSAERKKAVSDVMDKMEIAHRRNHFPQQLSGGQQQRVAVARAVVTKPALILADEPTGNLDSRNGEEVMKLLKALNREGTTVVMVTHSAEHAEYASRTLQMLDGKVVAENFKQDPVLTL